MYRVVDRHFGADDDGDWGQTKRKEGSEGGRGEVAAERQWAAPSRRSSGEVLMTGVDRMRHEVAYTTDVRVRTDPFELG